MYFVYRITNSVDGKIYVGKTNNLKRRKIEHISEAARDRRKNHLYNAIRKYGVEVFAFQVLAEFAEEEVAYEAERFFIAFFNTTDKRVGYNRTLGGEGVRHTPEGRKRISEAAKKRTGVRNSFFSHRHTPETKRHIAELARRRMKGNHPMQGRQHSEETRRKIGAARKGWQMPKEQRQQLSQHHAGERSSTAKITNAQAVELRLRRAGGASIAMLQSEYGLSRSSVYKVISGVTFKEAE
jgi:group I intron endonuclease